jgi:hypothetical protein
MRSSLTKTATALASVASLAAMSACSDVSSTAPRTLRPTAAAAGDFIPSPAQVLIPGATPGSFASYTANESIRDTPGSEFWDNLSSDDRPLGPLGPNRHPALGSPGSSHCNIGFYTTVTIGPDCAFKAAGSTNVAPNTYTQYWQDAGTGENDASAFSFSGTYQYTVTLKAAYSSGTSEVGYWYINGGVRTFVAVPGWGNKTAMGVVTPIAIPTTATSWGFYLKGTQITEAPTCGTNTVCSDQEANQHFALFLNTVTGNDYLVGVEDANLHPLWPASEPTNQDSDYQDYIFLVNPLKVVENITTWCSPGFWKNNGRDLWTAHQGEKYSTLSAFAAPLSKKAPAGYDPTLLEVIDNPSIYGGPATNSVSDYLSNLAFGTPIGSGVESCPGPGAIKPF